MKRQNPRLEPELEAFLKHPKVERHVPPEVRARALARGRAIVAAGGALPTGETPALPPAEPARPTFRIAVAAAIVVVVAAAVAAAGALHGRGAQPPPTPLPEHPAAVSHDPDTSVAKAHDPSPVPLEPAAPANRPRPGRAAKPEAFTAELELLQGAQAAYTRRDFPAALALAAEHARRFPKGQLAEQREALRVRSLVGLGRTDEAHRAAAAFAVRFPRSVLLQRVEEGPESSAR